MTARIIDGREISAKVRAEVARDAAEFTRRSGVVPHLAAVLVGDDPASAVYVRNKQRACESSGLRSTLQRCPADVSQDELLRLMAELNAAADVHGILVQLPLPRGIDPAAVQQAVHPLKDVDAFHPENAGLLLQGRPRFLPCTPHGCLRLLVESGIRIAGSHAVVLGRSDIVGKPMALLLLRKGADADATVTVCHSRSRDIASITREADILIAAIGKPHFVTADMVKPGAAVIDVGINRLDDGRLVGDVDFEAVREKAGALTPVPGGVGPMTIAMLLQNTLLAARLQAASR